MVTEAIWIDDCICSDMTDWEEIIAEEVSMDDVSRNGKNNGRKFYLNSISI